MCFLIKTDQYALGVFITIDSIEIIDPLGVSCNLKEGNLKYFLEAHTCGKSLSVSPRIVSSYKSNVILSVIFLFLYVKSLIGKQLVDFIKIFSRNFEVNEGYINDLNEYVSEHLRKSE